MPTLDMTKTDFSNRTLVPAGRYNFVVSTVKKVPAKNAGETNIKMEYDIISGGLQKRKCFDNVVFSKNSQWKVYAILQALAPNLNKSVALNEDIFVKAISGQRFSAEVRHKPSIKQTGDMVAEIIPNSYKPFDPTLDGTTQPNTIPITGSTSSTAAANTTPSTLL
jgi:hypothetical protein